MLAPRAKVTVANDATRVPGFVDGVVVARSYASSGGSAGEVELHGDGYVGPLYCAADDDDAGGAVDDDGAWGVYLLSNCSDPTPAPSLPPTTYAPSLAPTLSLAPTTPVCAHFGYANETCAADPTLVGYFGSEH